MLISGINIAPFFIIKNLNSNYPNKQLGPNFRGQVQQDTWEFSEMHGKQSINDGNSQALYPIKFELNLSIEELKRRTDEEYLTPRMMLGLESVEYAGLQEGDKKALKYLILAANMSDRIFMKQDNPDNIKFKEYIEAEAANGNSNAQLALRLNLA